MENVNRLLLENVLPAHVAAHFIGDKLNEVCWQGLARPVGRDGGYGCGWGPALSGAVVFTHVTGPSGDAWFGHRLHVQALVV